MLAFALVLELVAQGITTASIGGTVSGQSGAGIDAAEIRVIHRSTGVVTNGQSRTDGRYLVQGLPAGGPYDVVVRRIGYREQKRGDLALALGQYLRLDIALTPVPVELEPVVVEAEQASTFSSTIVSEKLLHQLPTANREVFGLLALVPQMSTTYGPSGGGVNYRFNSVRLDGAIDQGIFAGQIPGAVWGSRSISIEAVQEYQVLLSPYDVRQGDFAGALINGVTKSGTNQWHGTAFVYARNEQLARDVPYLRASPYDRALFGFSLGGPLVRDRAHFFVSTAFQQLRAPAPGPYIGQDPRSQVPVPVTPAQVDSFTQILRDHGLEPGSGGQVTVEVPTTDLFGRLDVSLPSWKSRLMVRYEYSHSDSSGFSRPIARGRISLCSQPECFPLSSAQRSFGLDRHSTAAKLSTQLGGGGYNEFHVAYSAQSGAILSDIPQPHIQVTVPSGSSVATMLAGINDNTQAFAQDQSVFEVSDNLTFPLDAHRVTVGVLAQVWSIRNLQQPSAYGVWQFSSLDSLQSNTAASYRVSFDQGSADASVRGVNLGVYAGDQWQLNDRFALTLGLRVDIPTVSGVPSYSSQVKSEFGRRTDVIPSGNAQWSPRAGFNWDLGGRPRQQLRGGAGLFAGRPPLAWLFQPFQSFGSGVATLVCRGANPPPPFPAMPDYRNPPRACANGAGPVATGPVNFVDAGLRFPQTFRATLSYDRELSKGVVATLEGMYTRATRDFLFLNANLADPVGTDRDGRAMYGSLDPLTGVADTNRISQQFANVDVMELRNQSRNYSVSLSAQLVGRLSDRAEVRAAYTWSRGRDVQTHYPTATINAGEEWRAQPYAGRQDDPGLEVSGFDQPHRIVLAGTFTMPWRRWQTDLSFYYVGVSGMPYTYVTTGSGGRGDLNADGSNANDPVYVPVSAFDPTEIRFQGTSTEVAAQQEAFAGFIEATPCLRDARGQILQRNACRSPWVNQLNLSVRQGLPSVRGHRLVAQLEVFNFLNLLNREWGAFSLPYPSSAPTGTATLMTHVGQSGGQPVFLFDPAMPRWNSENPDSYYQIQFSARYSF